MMSIAYDYSRDTSPLMPVAKDRLLLIDGRRVPSASGRTFKSLNPATEAVIATVNGVSAQTNLFTLVELPGTVFVGIP